MRITLPFVIEALPALALGGALVEIPCRVRPRRMVIERGSAFSLTRLSFRVRNDNYEKRKDLYELCKQPTGDGTDSSFLFFEMKGPRGSDRRLPSSFFEPMMPEEVMFGWPVLEARESVHLEFVNCGACSAAMHGFLLCDVLEGEG